MLNIPLIRLNKIQKSFLTSEGQKLLVLDNISLQLHEGDIVALLGKSGSGKSTLLRIIAGLTPPSQGQVIYRDREVNAPVQDVAMVFQNFALLPWLTVLENVELGLEAQGVPSKIRRQQALKAIDTIGMDGFESAYPKELSGGMRQRVGFARALVVEPDLLLMDEPFSALDILTAENLRNDLLDLWNTKRTRTKGILFVTHDIEEAILMANRIILINSNPGCIQTEVKVDLPFPRDKQSLAFRSLLDKIYTLLTISERERLMKTRAKSRARDLKHPEYAYRLPEVTVAEITGLLEAMESREMNGHINLPDLAEALHLDISNLFPLTEILDMLRFAKISEGDLVFLETGRQFAAADILQRKQLFAKHLLQYIPLAHHIREVLDNNPTHRVSEKLFIEELEEFLTEDEAHKLLIIMIDWGRYAEVFAYDYDTGIFSLENPQ
jgi:NitT/TauT family transport system ATP-binding protein